MHFFRRALLPIGATALGLAVYALYGAGVPWLVVHGTHGGDAGTFALTMERADVTGLPFHPALAITNLRASDRTGTEWQLDAERAVAALAPWPFQTARLALDRAPALIVGPLAWRAETARVDARLSLAGTIERVTVESAAPVLTHDGTETARAEALALMMTLDRETEAPMLAALSVAARTLELTTVAVPALGPVIQEAAGRFRAEPALPTLDRAALAAWRDWGGRIHVDGLEIAWGPLRVSARGTLVLDDELRPAGKLDARLQGFTAIIDVLEATGRLSENEAHTARIVLSLLAERQGNSGDPVLNVPLQAMAGSLFLGPVRIARLASVVGP